MSLTEAQIVDLSKMIGETYLATKAALPVVTAALTSEAVAAIEADLIVLITAYNTDEVGTNNVNIDGGRDGLKITADEERSLYSRTARKLLELDPVSAIDALSSDAMQYGFLRGPSYS